MKSAKYEQIRDDVLRAWRKAAVLWEDEVGERYDYTIVKPVALLLKAMEEEEYALTKICDAAEWSL
jgi:hypothetical protein